MRRQFKLPLKPFSVNAMYSGHREFKTAAYRNWERDFLHLLAQEAPQKALKDLRDTFVADQHCYRMRLVWHSPDLLTKDGRLSSRTFDVTNCEKIILDLLCLPKYHVQQWPSGCKNLNIDDKHVLTLMSGKRAGAKWSISVDIWLEDLQKYLL